MCRSSSRIASRAPGLCIGRTSTLTGVSACCRCFRLKARSPRRGQAWRRATTSSLWMTELDSHRDRLRILCDCPNQRDNPTQQCPAEKQIQHEDGGAVLLALLDRDQRGQEVHGQAEENDQDCWRFDKQDDDPEQRQATDKIFHDGTSHTVRKVRRTPAAMGPRGVRRTNRSISSAGKESAN